MQRYHLARSLGYTRSGASFSATGGYASLQVLCKSVRDRLRTIEYVRCHPSIKSVAISNPVFIVGLPRTGLAMLHQLLSLHPELSSHHTWESLSAIPITHEESVDAQEKDRSMRHNINVRKFEFYGDISGDDMQRAFSCGYDLPDDSSTALSQGMPWSLPELSLSMFAAAEAMDLGTGDAFQLYRQQLQLLTWQSKDRRDRDMRWLLRCSSCLPHMPELCEAFPDATLVWCHRHPVESIASACRLYERLMLWVMEPKSVNRYAIGEAVLTYSRCALDKAMDQLELVESAAKVVHVWHNDLVQIPNDVCGLLSEELGLAHSQKFNLLLYNHCRALDMKTESKAAAAAAAAEAAATVGGGKTHSKAVSTGASNPSSPPKAASSSSRTNVSASPSPSVRVGAASPSSSPSSAKAASPTKASDPNRFSHCDRRSLADYGLSEDTIKVTFSDYIARFNLG